MSTKTNILILLLLLGVGIVAMPDKKACAQTTGTTGTIAAQTCDTQVWQTMEARARLETEREIMQNQNLIFKPDSILQYTCFDKFAGHASENIGSLFTHTTYFGQKQILNWGDNGKYVGMDIAMQRAVVKPMQDYIAANFAHSRLGGRGQYMDLKGGEVVENLSGKGGTYACAEMNRVWKVAKCMNFMHAKEFAITDGYYPFKTLTSATNGETVNGYDNYNDVRDFPMNTACDGNPFVGSDWKQVHDRSLNVGEVLYKYREPNQKVYQAVSDRISPFGSSGSGGIRGGGTACGAPILTGVTVIPTAGAQNIYPDGICTNPGCSYQAGSGTTAGTCVAIRNQNPQNPTP